MSTRKFTDQPAAREGARAPAADHERRQAATADPMAGTPRQAAQRQQIDGLKAPAPRDALPDALRESMHAMSGVDLSGVRVHYGSARPAQLQAHAYAQGSEIHLAAGQEHQLAHEAWHLVQQRQGRVKPTGQLGGVAINDSPALEREADVMGARAAQMKRAPAASGTDGCGCGGSAKTGRTR